MKLPKKKLFFSLLLLIFLFLVVPSEALALAPLVVIGAILGSKLFWGAVITVAGAGLLSKFGPGIAGDIGAGFLNALIGVIYIIPLTITATFYLLATILLMWVIDPNFLGIGITKPENEVAYATWRLVRDFANMGFILALVAIGLGTALRYGEYQLRKALPLLIIIALLINFTPVIMGILIDASNIVISFFVKEAVGKNLWELAKGVYEASFKPFTQITEDPTANLAAATAQLIFNILGTLITLLFFLLFFFRYLALMILFILSPLAFFAYILPITRPFWHLWWHQFFSWLLVGVFGAFFLMLAAKMTHFMWDVTLPSGAFMEGPFQWFADFFAVFIVAALPIAILYLGFLITLQTSAMGAQRVIRVGKVAGAWAGTKALQRGKTYAKEKWQKSPMAERISKRLSRAQAPEEVRIMGRKIPGVSQVAKWGAGGAYAVSRAVGRAGIAVRERGPEDIAREEEEAKKRGVEMKVSHLLSPEKTKTQREATFLAAYEQRQLKPLEKLIPEERRKAVIEQLGREAMEIHPEVFKRFARAYPKMAEKIAEKFPEERREAAGMVLTDADRRKRYRTVVDKIVGEMKTEEIAKMAPSSLEEPEVKEAFHEFWGGTQIGAAGRAFDRDFVDPYMQTAHSRGREWYEEHNPKPLRYLDRTPAGELGFSAPAQGGSAEPKPGVSSEKWLTHYKEQLKSLESRPSLTLDEITRRDALIREVKDLSRLIKEEKEERRRRPPPPPGPPPPRGRPGVGPRRPPRERPPRPPRGRPGVGVRPPREEEPIESEYRVLEEEERKREE